MLAAERVAFTYSAEALYELRHERRNGSCPHGIAERRNVVEVRRPEINVDPFLRAKHLPFDSSPGIVPHYMVREQSFHRPGLVLLLDGSSKPLYRQLKIRR